MPLSALVFLAGLDSNRRQSQMFLGRGPYDRQAYSHPGRVGNYTEAGAEAVDRAENEVEVQKDVNSDSKCPDIDDSRRVSLDDSTDSSIRRDSLDDSTDSSIRRDSLDDSTDSSIRRDSLDDSTDSSIRRDSLDDSTDSSIRRDSLDDSTDSSIRRDSLDDSTDSSIRRDSLDDSTDSSIRRDSLDDSTDSSIRRDTPTILDKDRPERHFTNSMQRTFADTDILERKRD
ncbi:dentin sialophosphoprotein-like [Procambarus clarkii]|uniref:dentin sialophosphoprotein-like n=1 Tax=Procambarus clarkii TaxID=6728 RepID=UPI0037446DBA